MKTLSLIIGILCFVLLSPSVFAATDKVVSEFYTRVAGQESTVESSRIDTVAATRLAAVLGTTSVQILAYIHGGNIVTDEGDLKEVCVDDSPQNTETESVVITQLETVECFERLEYLWERERTIAALEFFTTQQTAGFSRWWDGHTTGNEDFDVLTDLYLIDRQFFEMEESFSQAPQPDTAIRNAFSLAEYNYRLPGGIVTGIGQNVATASDYSIISTDSLPFFASGGCPLGQISMYGGLVCLPRYCTDFLCVNVKPIPGYRETVATRNKGATKSTVGNIVLDMKAIATRLKDAKQSTPTRNTNQGHWWSQMFNWDQLWHANFTAVPRPLPIFDGLIAPDGSEAKKETYQYGYDSESGEFTLGDAESASTPDALNIQAPIQPQATAEQTASIEDVYEELKQVHSEFGLCNGDPDCSSYELLKAFERDCEVFGNRAKPGSLERTLDTCVSDLEERIDNNPLTNWQSHFVKTIEMKQQFDQQASAQMLSLSQSISSFLQTLNGINECALRQAQYSCGISKQTCAAQNSSPASSLFDI